MLTVIDKNTAEPLVNYKGYEAYEERNGPLTLSFTSIASENNPGHKLLKGEVVVESEDGRQFRVKQLSGSTYRKQVSATSTYFDLKGTQKYDIFGGTKTLHEFLTWVLQGSGWTFEVVDIPETRLMANFGKADALKLIEILLSEFECERKILPGNHLRFEKQIGPDHDAQYRYDHNIKALILTEDTTNFGTVIRGYGANGLSVTYRSPKADTMGEIHAEPFTDERFTKAESLLERLKKELQDEPEVAYELDAYELTEKEIGERVWLIHEPLGVEFQTRVLAKTTRIPKENSTVVIGNVKPKSATDQLVDQDVKLDESNKETDSKFDQTNDKIDLVVEEVSGELNEAKASWAVEATGIRGEVTSLKTYTDTELGKVEERASSNFDLLAGRITAKADYTQVTALGTRINSVEFDLNAMDAEITLKVDRDGVIGAINLSPEIARIQAHNIELVGAVSVLSELSGNLGSITAGQITGTNFTLSQSGLLDLRLGTILWGTNKPQADYAENAGNANLLNGQYTYRSFALTGHVHQNNEYVKPYTGQELKMWRAGNKVRVYMGADYVELSGVIGS